MDNKDKHNIIDLLEKIEERKQLLDQEYALDDYAWETQVDLSLQELSEYVEQVVLCSKAMILEIEDLRGDVDNLKQTVNTLLRQLYLQKTTGVNNENEP